MLDPNVPVAGVVLALMLVELGVGRIRGERLYGLAETLSDLGSSLGQLVVQSMLGFTTLAMYVWMAEHLAWLEVPYTAGGWVFGWLAMEFLFYWRHRAGHELALFWTIHQVHHQSPELNLAVAQRVGYLQWLHTALFVWPLALLGVPPLMFGVLFGIIHFYQFLIHTRLVGRLGPLEWVLMTPSHHRAHHGRNRCYLDCNYGFTLVLFDRLFGTFVPEEEPPEYGIVAPLPSWSPLDNNVRPWIELGRKLQLAGPRGALAVAFGRPAPASPGVSPPRQVPAEGGSTLQRVGATGLVGVSAVVALALVQFTETWDWGLRLVAGFAVLGMTAWAAHLVTGVDRDR